MSEGKILLRTLTRESKLNVGNIYKRNTVGDLLNNKRYYYLRYIFYKHPVITFTEDILQQLGIKVKKTVK